MIYVLCDKKLVSTTLQATRPLLGKWEHQYVATMGILTPEQLGLVGIHHFWKGTTPHQYNKPYY